MGTLWKLYLKKNTNKTKLGFAHHVNISCWGALQPRGVRNEGNSQDTKCARTRVHLCAATCAVIGKD